MNNEVKMAIDLRKEGHHKESNEMLIRLARQYPEDAYIQYQCASSFDLLGEESSAVPFYEKAIELGLPEKDLEGAFLGLGSTFRTLGEYRKSKDVFEKGIAQFPHNKALQVFYAMTLYNIKEHGSAMEILLNCLVDTTTNEDILQYNRAIHFYADKLDQTWS